MNTEKQACDLDKILADMEGHVDACKAASVPCSADVLMHLLVKAAGSLREVKAVADLAHANSVKALELATGADEVRSHWMHASEVATTAHNMAMDARDSARIAMVQTKQVAKPAAVKKPAAKKAPAKKAA